MNRENYPDDSFYKSIENMTLPDLEIFTEALGKEPKMNCEKIDACLGQRKYLLNNMFECTSENVERLFCVANLVKDRVAMLHEKGNQLYSQICQLWKEGKNPPLSESIPSRQPQCTTSGLAQWRVCLVRQDVDK